MELIAFIAGVILFQYPLRQHYYLW